MTRPPLACYDVAVSADRFDGRNQLATPPIEAVEPEKSREQVAHILRDEGTADFFMTLEKRFNGLSETHRF